MSGQITSGARAAMMDLPVEIGKLFGRKVQIATQDFFIMAIRAIGLDFKGDGVPGFTIEESQKDAFARFFVVDSDARELKKASKTAHCLKHLHRIVKPFSDNSGFFLDLESGWKLSIRHDETHARVLYTVFAPIGYTS